MQDLEGGGHVTTKKNIQMLSCGDVEGIQMLHKCGLW